MRRFTAILLVSFRLIAAPATELLGSWTSPTGALKAEAFFTDGDSPRTVYVFNPTQPLVRETLCTFERSAAFLFSPDERWIAMNDMCGSSEEVVRFFKRAHGLKFIEVKMDPGNAAWKLLRERHHVSYPDSFDHRYIAVTDWSNNSSAVLVSLEGHGDRIHHVDTWYCVFDLRTGKASLDLNLLNKGTVVSR